MARQTRNQEKEGMAMENRMLTYEENAAVHIAAQRLIAKCERIINETLADEITAHMASGFCDEVKAELLRMAEKMPDVRT